MDNETAVAIAREFSRWNPSGEEAEHFCDCMNNAVRGYHWAVSVKMENAPESPDPTDKSGGLPARPGLGSPMLLENFAEGDMFALVCSPAPPRGV